ncbi:hypothetical protein [Nocardia yamanashiensis]|uniref:hypothetical protein n=1 Tax=Nocardia yamanashiensis TaxID=209247 RepID=UPI000ABAB32D|nr:hypothetical protein [Nocardia yamanashiensis]
MAVSCPWCRLNHIDDDPDPDQLCLTHLAEYEGTSVRQLVRGEAIQYAEWHDATH